VLILIFAVVLFYFVFHRDKRAPLLKFFSQLPRAFINSPNQAASLDSIFLRVNR